MPESPSSSEAPVGIIISPGRSRTTGTRLRAYLWSTEPDAEREAEREAGSGTGPADRTPRTGTADPK